MSPEDWGTSMPHKFLGGYSWVMICSSLKKKISVKIKKHGILFTISTSEQRMSASLRSKQVQEKASMFQNSLASLRQINPLLVPVFYSLHLCSSLSAHFPFENCSSIETSN